MADNNENQGLISQNDATILRSHETCVNMKENSNVSGTFGNSCLSKDHDEHLCGCNSHASRGKTKSSTTTVFVKEEKQKKQCSKTLLNCICPVISICLSIMAILAVAILYFDRDKTVELVSTEPPMHSNLQGQSAALKGHPGNEKITGRFKMDQDEFLKSNKTHIRWIPATGTNSLIKASPDSHCLIVPEKGTYGVFSMITFSIYKNDHVTKLAHFMKLEGYQPGEQFFQRKIFAVPVPENRSNPESIPSTLISFPRMEANGRICIYTAENRMKYIFPSSIDNTINIFKV